MTITNVFGLTEVHDATSTNTSLGLPITSAISAGDLIAVGYNLDPGIAFTSIGDNASGGSNTYTIVGSTLSDADYVQAIYACTSAKAATANTVTTTIHVGGPLNGGGGNGLEIYLGVFHTSTGVWTVDQFSHANTPTGTAVNAGSINTGFANCLSFSFTGVNHTVTTPFPASPWVNTGVGVFGDMASYRIDTALQTGLNAAYVQSASGIWVASIASFGVQLASLLDVIQLGTNA